MPRQLPFPQSYEQLVVPDPIDVEDDEQATAVSEKYAQDLKAAIGLGHQALEMFFTQSEADNQVLFSLETLQLLGTITKIQDENGTHLIFEKKKLLPKTTAIVKDLELAEVEILKALDH